MDRFAISKDFCRFIYSFSYKELLLLLLLLLLLKKVSSARPGESDNYTPYQSEDPSPTIPTYRQKEEKGKESRRL